MPSTKSLLTGLILLLLNYITKTYKIESGPHVVWDEAHFGKFASRYLKNEFYFDVHPPLGKMMTALSGKLAGQDPTFKFESGTKYPANFYLGMRRFHALVGSFIPLFAYGIMRELGYKICYSFVFASLMVFENGMTSISRLILLDSHLMFFTAGTAYFLTRLFARNRRRKFNARMVDWGEICDLVVLGLCIGCVMSVKWIGCLTTLLVGLYIIFELYSILMSKRSLSLFVYKFAIRALALIVLPITLYLFWFLIHFGICNKSTSDEAHMSSFFQATLKRTDNYRIRKYVPFGGILTIKSSKLAGGNLHSHHHDYPDSGLKQITTYFHKDTNNEWAFQKVIEDGEKVDYLRDNDEIVLFHIQTKCYISGDNVEAYRSHGRRVVGVSGVILKTCVWIVEIDSDKIGKEDRVKTISTRFRLRNKETGLYLCSTGKQYPEWGFSQGEVICADTKDSDTLWNVEENKLADGEDHEEYTEISNLSSSFISHVIELNKAMYNSNKSLVQDKNLQPIRIVSRPYVWFILRRGLRMNGWDDSNSKFYMFGNPLIWYMSTICILITPIILFCKTISRLRKGKRVGSGEYYEVFLCFGGWAIHYLPFFVVGRVLYFHHYFPALFFAVFSINYILKQISRRIMFGFVGVAVGMFVYFSCLTYGIDGPAAGIGKKQWVGSWDFV